MSIVIDMAGERATVRGYAWTCENPTMEALLNGLSDLFPPLGSDPNPEQTLADLMQETYGAEIVSVNQSAGYTGGEGPVFGEKFGEEDETGEMERLEGPFPDGSFLARLEQLGASDDSDWNEALFELLLSRATHSGPKKPPLTGGQWVTINGAHVYIKGGHIVAGHIHGAAAVADLGDESKKALLDAHAAGQLPTDGHLYGALDHALHAMADGQSEADAVKSGIDTHGEAPTAPVAGGETKVHSLPVVTNKANHVYGKSVKVVTHGHSVDEGDVAAMAKLAEVSPKATAALLDAHAQGKITDDHHLAALIKDMHDVHAATHYFTPAVALGHLLDGKTADEATAHGKALKKQKGKESADAKKAAVSTPAPVDPTPAVPAPDTDAMTDAMSADPMLGVTPPAPAAPVPPTPTSPASPSPVPKTLKELKIAAQNLGMKDAFPSAMAMIKEHLASGQITSDQVPTLLEKAAEAASAGFETKLKGVHIDAALLKLKSTAPAPVPAPAPAPAVAPPLLSTEDASNYLKTKGVKGFQADAAKFWENKVAVGEIHEGNAQIILDGIADAFAKNPGLSSNWSAAVGHIKAPLSGAASTTSSPNASTSPDHVTLKDASGTAHQMMVDHSKPATHDDVDALKNQGVKITDNGVAALKEAITKGDIKSHGHLMETAAMAQASSKHMGQSSINGGGVKAMLTQHGGQVENLLDAAHGGNPDAKGISSHLSDHSFMSPAEKAEKAAAQKKLDEVKNFHAASPEDHLHNKLGGKKGSNDAGLYEMPDGQQNYVKFHPEGSQIPHSEHAANAIYKALGLNAPESKVFDHNGQTLYASKIIPDTKTLGETIKGQKGKKLTKEQGQQILQGFAADALLGNWDALGMSNDNMMVGADGTIHRIDNGGAGLYKAMGGKKDDKSLHALHEWRTLADPTVNPNYAKVFEAAGIKSPAEIPHIAAQIKAIAKLRDENGGWQGFLAKASPGMSHEEREKLADMLESRTEHLLDKLKTLPGANSVVGTRTFAFSSSYSKQESNLIAWHKDHGVPLTADQQSALKNHQGSGYASAAHVLLGKSTATPTAETLANIKHLDDYFAQPGVQIGRDVALSRTMPMGKAEVDKLRTLAPGSIIGNTPIHQSTSTNSMTSVAGDDVQLCILAPKETPGVPMRAYSSSLASEAEVVLPRGLSYRVVAVMNPGDANAPEVPAEWKWRPNAEKKGVRLVVEPIIAGVNDAEAHVPAVHHINENDIVKGQEALAATGIQVPKTPNVSGINTEAPWNEKHL